MHFGLYTVGALNCTGSGGCRVSGSQSSVKIFNAFALFAKNNSDVVLAYIYFPCRVPYVTERAVACQLYEGIRPKVGRVGMDLEVSLKKMLAAFKERGRVFPAC